MKLSVYTEDGVGKSFLELSALEAKTLSEFLATMPDKSLIRKCGIERYIGNGQVESSIGVIQIGVMKME